MKRAKVTRYYAGKRPAYAKEEDEEEYVTDDEEDEVEDEESSSDKSDVNLPSPDSHSHDIEEEDDEDDDPRFRRLKQIEAKANPPDLINAQRTQQITPKYDLSRTNLVLDEDDDEEKVRQRHAIARKRQLEEPLGPQAVLGTTSADQRPELVNDEQEDEDSTRLTKRLDTDDILKDLKLTGISRPVRERQKTEEDQEAESRRLKEMLELAKQEATLTSQTLKKVEEDIRRDREKEALAKGDIGAREMSSAITDDEDEELAYEEWKFREIKRVQRDRSERMLLVAARAR